MSDMQTPQTPGLIPRRGYVYVIIAALLWAASGASGKFLFHRGVTPFELVQMRVTLSALCLFVFLLALKPGLLKISKRDLLYFAVLGISGMAMVQFTYFYTISKINVAVAILLEYFAPVFIAVWYAFSAPDKLTRTTLFALLVSIAGCYLAVGAYNVDLLAQNKVGIAVGICSGLSYGWYAIYGEKGMRKYDPLTVVFYALAFAALFWNTFLFPLDAFRRSYSPVEWFWVFYIVVFGTVVPYGLYSEGISLVRSTRASVTATLEPIAAGFLAFFFLGENLAPLQILGGVLVIASVILFQVGRESDETTSAILRARRSGGP
ncbi:MAG: DMT family transporter [Syntrophobacteraceae bacterium]